MPEFTYDAGATALQMARLIFGRSAIVTGASFTGNPHSSATYSGGEAALPGDRGVILSTGAADALIRHLARNAGTGETEATGNSDAIQFRPAFLEIDFIPDSAEISLRMELGFNDVPETSGPIFRDAVQVWMNGIRIPLAVGSREDGFNIFDDPDDTDTSRETSNNVIDTSAGGLSAMLLLRMAVEPGELNSIRIGVADTDDALYETTMMIAAHAPHTLVTAGDDTVTIVARSSATVDLLANDTAPGGTELFITHINGQEVFAGDVITLSTGQTITVNGDGTVTITADADIETVTFDYTVATGVGNSQITDTGFVTIDTVPCFVAGTLIRTDRGEVPVERLKPGDRVLTRDDGMQPLRWIGRRRVPAEGKMAPVRIDRNTFGRHDAVSVSPLHRILVENTHAELLFGSHQVLIAAKDLIDGCRVRQLPGGDVDYIHLLFDRHQVVWSNGLPSESFLPGPQTTGSFEADMVAEIRAIFPHVDPRTGAGYGPAARPALKRYEARLLVA